MEEERSRAGNSGKRARSGGEDGGRTATEEEVEEFFAILRRIHAATSHFGKGKNRQMTVTEKGARWRPSFELEDFVGVNGVKTDGEVETVKRKGVMEIENDKQKKKKKKKTEEEGERALELDLNAVPQPEHTAHFSV